MLDHGGVGGGGIEGALNIFEYIKQGNWIAVVLALRTILQKTYYYFQIKRTVLVIDLSIKVELNVQKAKKSWRNEKQIHRDIYLNIYEVCEDLQNEINRTYPTVKVSKELVLISHSLDSSLTMEIAWYTDSHLNKARILDIINGFKFHNKVSYRYKFRKFLWPLCLKLDP